MNHGRKLAQQLEILAGGLGKHLLYTQKEFHEADWNQRTSQR
jgi:hypothetical protein